ncbi:MAG: tyrosine decarboxylase MfnA [Thermoplasmata archaeon]|nr:MAG: tyrosine decarboxylase MfnA [Thermoplasmata archaeon]
MVLDRDKVSEVFKQLERYKSKDYSFSNGRILGSMCTEPHPIARGAYLKFLDVNLGDPGLFPGSKEMEMKLIEFTGKLFHIPKTATGLSVSGGTEGNITAIWIAKKLINGREMIIPKHVHFSFQKIASLMDIKLIPVDLTSDYTIDINSIRKHINSNTFAVVGVAGSTDLGVIDPISELSEICLEEHIFLHIDAAFGGFVIPFLENHLPFDFSLPGVSSLSVDFHKMGYSAIPLGILFLRDKNWLDEISVESTCISIKRQAGLLGTRSAGPIAAAYAVTQYLGYDGYRKIVEKCMETTRYAEEKIQSIGLSIIRKPILNILGVKLRNPSKVIEVLSRKGWKVGDMSHLSCIRIVVMPHVTKKVIDEFIPVLEEVCLEVGEI